MTNSHLSEPALQAAAEAALLPAPEAAHLRGCPQCQRQVAAYQQLFAAVAQVPPPAFSFDLAAAVLAQLPRPKPAFPAWVLGGVISLVLSVIVAFLALFGGVLREVFQSLSTGLGVGLAVVAGFLVAGQFLELLARHRRQLRALAFS
jgi:anti-sigma factor RsiW